MIRSYFVIAIRNLWKNKTISLINILGLALGMSAFLIVRKVLGATVPQLIKLLSQDLVILIIAAYVLSLPVAYFIASAWLENYSFKMPMRIWMFIAPILILLPVALITVSAQIIKVASSNPVNTLRNG